PFSEMSPLMPTAPMSSPAWSRISTPPGTGMIRPPEAALSAWMKAGLAAARRANSRPPKPIPRAPQALPPAISGRSRLGSVLTLQRLQLAGGVEHRHGQRLEAELAPLLQRLVDDDRG